MTTTVSLDKIDLKILQALQHNGRLSNVELSERVALSPSPCLRRLKQLESSGIIRGYAALVHPSTVALGLQVFIRVSVDKSNHLRDGFADSVRDWPQVLRCFALTDMESFSQFILDTLLAHPGVVDARSSFVLQEVKNSTVLPLDHLQTE